MALVSLDEAKSISFMKLQTSDVFVPLWSWTGHLSLCDADNKKTELFTFAKWMTGNLRHFFSKLKIGGLDKSGFSGTHWQESQDVCSFMKLSGKPRYLPFDKLHLHLQAGHLCFLSSSRLPCLIIFVPTDSFMTYNTKDYPLLSSCHLVWVFNFSVWQWRILIAITDVIMICKFMSVSSCSVLQWMRSVPSPSSLKTWQWCNICTQSTGLQDRAN